MIEIAKRLKAYIDIHPFDPGDSDCETVLDQLYQAYAESHESDPSEISEGFKKLEEFLCTLPLEDNNAVFNLCCRLCSTYERKAFLDGVQYGALLLMELKE
jgi:hypothetical protein